MSDSRSFDEYMADKHGAPEWSSSTSAFNRAYIALSAGYSVRVADDEGRLGTIVAMSEGDPSTRTYGDASVQFDRGGVVVYSSTRFNARLRIVSPEVAR